MSPNSTEYICAHDTSGAKELLRHDDSVLNDLLSLTQGWNLTIQDWKI